MNNFDFPSSNTPLISIPPARSSDNPGHTGHGVLHFARRGLAMHISTFNGEPLGNHDCGDCRACVEICPVGALYYKKDRPEKPA